MLDKKDSDIISYHSADSNIPLEYPEYLAIDQDTVMSSESEIDTVEVSADSLAVSLPDTLTVSSHDSLAVSLPDSLPVSTLDTISVSLPDPLLDTVIVEADEITGKQIEEVQDEIQQPDYSQHRDTIQQREEITPVSPQISNVLEKTYKYDDSYYLNAEKQTLFFQDHLFPFPCDKEAVSQGNKVLIETDTTGINVTSLEYKAYLQNDMHEKFYENTYSSLAWIPAIVILSLLLLTWIKVIYVQFLSPVLVSAFNYKEATKLYHEKNAPAQNAFLILHVIFAINAGLFILFTADYFHLRIPDVSPVYFFLGSSVFIVLLFAIKFFALTLIGFLFDNSKVFSEYIHNISLYNKIYGILLLPLIVGLLYLGDYVYSELIYAGIILGGVFYLLQLVRGLEIIIKKEVSVFYLILYLCALEILPIFVLYKLFLVLLI